MHDLRWIRENKQELTAAMVRRNTEIDVDRIIALDIQHRELLTQMQDQQNQRNNLAKEIGQAKAKGLDIQPLLDQGNAIKEQLPAMQIQTKEIETQLHDMLSHIPNIMDDCVPDGVDENDNKELSRHGVIKKFDFPAKYHYDLGHDLGMMDFETAAKVSGSRFVYLSDDLARLEQALASFMLDLHSSEHGFRRVSTPLLVRSHSLFGTGQLPKFKDDHFHIQDHDLCLIPTSEVPLANMVRESIIEQKKLPMRLCAYSPCFRAEAGAAGRDTRGMIRQHQFHKVELVTITTPQDSNDEHEHIKNCAMKVLEMLDLPFRVVLLCSGDTGFTARKTYDLEVWLPSDNMYREISSCSNCGDFQARRMDAKYRPFSTDGGKPKSEFMHTLNGSGIAVGRALLAVMENYQNSDGSITIPEVLRPYMGNQDLIKKIS